MDMGEVADGLGRIVDECNRLVEGLVDARGAEALRMIGRVQTVRDCAAVTYTLARAQANAQVREVPRVQDP